MASLESLRFAHVCTCLAVFVALFVVYAHTPVYGLSQISEWTRPPHDLQVICYVGTWANYRLPPADFLIDNIDPSLCTHLLYSFVGLQNLTYTMISLDPWADLDPDEGGRGGFRKMTGLKREHPHLTVLLAVGGFDEGSVKFSNMASSIITRKRFIESALGFVQKYEFDGLDLDWEFPGKRGGVPEDRENFVSLVKELRIEFDKYGLQLSAAIHAGVDTMETAYDLPALGEHLDLINIMAYDYHGSWDNITGANAPLYAQEDLWSVEDTLAYLQEAGAPLEKLMLGLPTYGHTFLLDDPAAEGSQELGAPCASEGFAGPYTMQNGFYGFHEICLELQDPKWKQYWDNNTGTPYMVARQKVIAYDDEISLTLKVDYAVRFGVGGVMLWSIDTDDFRGDCSDDGNRYPLLKRVNEAVMETLGSQTTTSDPNTTETTTAETTTTEIVTTTDPSTDWTRPPHDLPVVCYVSSWANYRVSPANFTVQSIDPRLCTHLIYAFAGLDNETFTIISLDPWTDLDPADGGRGFYRQMTGLKKEHPHLKVLLAIGGFDEGSKKYSELAGSTIRRMVFVNSVVEFVLKYEFDGLDVDWEYPGERGGVPEDRENFVILIKDLRTAFDEHGLLVTAAFHAGVSTMETAYDFPALGEHLHLMNIMAYDYHGPFDNVTGANAPLYAQADNFSVTDTLLYLERVGAPLHKVMLGLPLYGHTFLLDDPEAEGSQDFGAPCDNTGFPGDYTNSSGFMGYNEICLELKDSKWKQYWDEGTGTPYIIYEEKEISYDDEYSISLKVDYAVRFGIGGLMLWSIDTDDFQGHCGVNKFPVLKRVSLAVMDTLNSMENATTTQTPPTTSNPVDTSTMVTTTTTGRPTVTEPPHNLKIICYVKTWANYRVVPSAYFIEDIDPTLCTHLMYAFAGLDNKTYEIKSLDPWTDLNENEGGRGFFKKMTGLRANHPHLTVMLAIGGESEGSLTYSQLAADPVKRAKFVTSVIKMLLKYEFNGLDLNWQYPGELGGSPDDKDNFVLLVKDLHDEFDRYDFVLSAALHGDIEVMERAYDLPVLSQYLDLMNIMTYDYHRAQENVTGANAPFYSQPDNSSVTDTLMYLKSAGIPLDKVMLGLPLYGQTFLVSDPEGEEQHLGATCQDTGFPGVYTQSDGFMGYHEVCLEAKDSYWKPHWDNSTGTPYMVYNEKLVAFDDEHSIELKVNYGVNFGIGGFTAWSIDTDDFQGHCGNGRYPLLTHISDTIVRTLYAATASSSSSSSSASTTRTTTTTTTPRTTGTGSSTSASTGTTTTKKPGGGTATSVSAMSALALLIVALMSLLIP